nr:response regulator [uncultured Desulfuromonas sp.]
MADKILLVDDDPALLKLAEKILTQEGYKVALAHNGLEALSVFRRAPNDYFVVVTDYHMPGLDGVMLSQKVVEIKPQTPVILASADPELKNLGTHATNIKGCLRKPYHRKALLTAIADSRSWFTSKNDE